MVGQLMSNSRAISPDAIGPARNAAMISRRMGLESALKVSFISEKY